MGKIGNMENKLEVIKKGEEKFLAISVEEAEVAREALEFLFGENPYEADSYSARFFMSESERNALALFLRLNEFLGLTN